MSDLPKYLTVEEILKNVIPSTVAADVKREMEIERLTEKIIYDKRIKDAACLMNQVVGAEYPK